jgi:hypothetical protein
VERLDEQVGILDEETAVPLTGLFIGRSEGQPVDGFAEPTVS